MRLWPATLVVLLALAKIAAGEVGFVRPAARQPAPPPSASERAQQPEPLPPVGPSQSALSQSALSLSDLEGIALANHPSLAQAFARVQAARGRYVQAGLRPNPQGGYTADEIGNEGTAGMQGGFVSQQIVTGGKLSRAQAAAGQEVVQLQRLADAERQRVLSDVRTQFYEVLAAQRSLDVAALLSATAAKAEKAATDLFNGGNVAKTDVLQAQIEVSSSRVARQAAQNRYVTAWRRLAAVSGVPQLSPTALAGDLEADLPELEWHTSLARIMACSPELAAARAAVSRAAWLLARAQAEPVPNVGVEAAVQHDNSTGDTVTSVRVGVPIVIRNRNQGGIREAQGNLAAARAEVRRLELALHNRLAIAFERYANARNQATAYRREILPAAETTLRLTTQAYTAGELSFVDQLTAQRTQFQSQLAYLTALRELRETTTLIEGLLLSDSLQITP